MASSLVNMSAHTAAEPMATELNAYVGGAIMLAILLMLLLLTWAFRSVRTRH
ncbi:hypothetical protein ACPYO6_00250 [Georgenia sp. Z1344]|uniref:hypothetical protein n=1 Tax=Georgenia sp. Z1344 TaxID=3416706 RepID=UPI003CF07DF8